MHSDHDDKTMRLLLHKVPARHGLLWIRQGWQVFRGAPLALSALLASYLIAWLLIGLLGTPGAALMLATLPLLSLVYMVATHQLLQKRPLGFAVWAQPFKLTKRRLHAQLQLGLLYVILTVALMLLAHQLDGGALERLQTAMGEAGRDEASARAAEAALAEAVGNPDFLLGLLLRLLARRCSPCPSGMRQRSCTGAAMAPSRPCSPAAWGCGPTAAPSH